MGRFRGGDGVWTPAEFIALRDRTGGVSAAARGVKADGATDGYAAVQALIDDAASGGGGASRLPPGQLILSHPLYVPDAGVALLGDPAGRTVLYPTWGSGPCLLAQYTRPGLPLSASPLAGPGAAFDLHNGAGDSCLGFGMEPLTDVSGRTSMTCEVLFRRRSAANGVHFDSGIDLGVARHHGFGLWELAGGGLRVVWGGVDHDTAGGLLALGVWHHAALTFDGARVRLWLDGVMVLDFASPSPTVPQLPGVEQLFLGRTVRGPTGAMLDIGGPQADCASFRLSAACRYAAPFTPPAAKFTLDADTLLLMNFETDGPFVVGRRAGGGTAYFVPSTSAERQMSGLRLENLRFDGGSGASGPVLYDVIEAELRNLRLDSTHWGYSSLGSTYANQFDCLRGIARTFCWLQGAQAMATSANGLFLNGGGVVFHADGAVGGAYSGVLMSPTSQTVCSLYAFGGTDLNFLNFHNDDEGQAAAALHCVVADAATVKFFGGRIDRRGTPGPAYETPRAGAVQLWGTNVTTL